MVSVWAATKPGYAHRPPTPSGQLRSWRCFLYLSGEPFRSSCAYYAATTSDRLRRGYSKLRQRKPETPGPSCNACMHGAWSFARRVGQRLPRSPIDRQFDGNRGLRVTLTSGTRVNFPCRKIARSFLFRCFELEYVRIGVKPLLLQFFWILGDFYFTIVLKR